MANRLAFLPTELNSSKLYREELIEFEWVPGMAISQGRKSVRNLHEAAKEQLKVSEILEISTRSQIPLGVALSAFNLKLRVLGFVSTVETAYQSSKVFEGGGPYLDIFGLTSLQAKKDPRLKSSGNLVGFHFENRIWPLTASPNFYDYLYIRGLLDSDEMENIVRYEAFTDLAFSQNSLKQKIGKSFNCQARSAAIFVSLLSRMKINQITSFLEKSAIDENGSTEQLKLFP